MSKEEFDTTYTDNLTCPHCGHEHDHDFEGEYDEEFDKSCDNCEEYFDFTVELALRYNSKKKSTENKENNG